MFRKMAAVGVQPLSAPYQSEIPEASARLCEYCFSTQPLSEFRRRKRGSEHRVRQCRQCHNEFERYRRAAARVRLSKQKIARDLSRVRDASSANRVKALCAEIVRGYGGSEGFVRAWIACLHGDLLRGGFAALRHLEATMRLIQHCEQDRPDYSQMSDEELEVMLKSLQ